MSGEAVVTSTFPAPYQSNRRPMLLSALAMYPSSDIDACATTVPMVFPSSVGAGRLTRGRTGGGRRTHRLKRCPLSMVGPRRSGSRGNHVLDLLHVAVGGLDRLRGGLSVLSGVEVWGVPVPPVVWGRGLLERVVLPSGFVQQ